MTVFASFNDHSAVVVKSRGFSCYEYANISFVLTINAELPSRIKASMAFFVEPVDSVWLVRN